MTPPLANLETWLWSAAVVAGSALLALLLYWLLYSALRRIARRTANLANESVVRRTAAPAKLILPLLAVYATLHTLPLGPRAVAGIRHAILLVLIAGVAWATARLLDVIQDLVMARYRIDAPDNFTARRISTQVAMAKRIAIVLIAVIAIGSMLMTFPEIWNLGATLFASAGVAGVIAGMAARPALSNLLAGIQVALTEPIRLGDVVVVEGEWGIVEEIRTAYVVVRVWDLRRLIVPLSYFIEKPFQNWTRDSTELLATVFVYADYNVPVDDVRQEYRRILEASGMWDGKVWALHVTNATDQAVELRALMSVPNSGVSWDLRCHVREKLVHYLQERHPETLPKARTELRRAPASRAGA